jgi:NAD(P)-dependent dehydrogenase (short-subunit alcohol dehydrogenase family)
LTALAPDALAGVDVGYAETPTAAGAPASGDDRSLRALAGGLAELGARISAADPPVDLLLVPVDGKPPRPTANLPVADAGALPAGGRTSVTNSLATLTYRDSTLDAAADGMLAAALTAAFTVARDGASRLRPGGCLLFVLSPVDAVARAAVASLTRTLALEWAPDHRVNAIACPNPADAVDLVALVAWRASRTLTGAILDAVPANPA